MCHTLKRLCRWMHYDRLFSVEVYVVNTRMCYNISWTSQPSCPASVPTWLLPLTLCVCKTCQTLRWSSLPPWRRLQFYCCQFVCLLTLQCHWTLLVGWEEGHLMPVKSCINNTWRPGGRPNFARSHKNVPVKQKLKLVLVVVQGLCVLLVWCRKSYK